MAFYNRSGKKLDLKLYDMQYLGSGVCAKVLHNSDVAFKEYFPSTPEEKRLSPSDFDVLKGVNNPHFIELYDIYSNFDLLELLKLKIKRQQFSTGAYTAKYYPDDSVNVLLENKDYILDNFRELEKLFEMFAEDNIMVHDLKRDNSILGKNGIVLIDPDLFVVNPDLRDLIDPDLYAMFKSRFSMLAENKNNLLFLLDNIFADASLRMGLDDESSSAAFDDLFDFKVGQNTDVTHEISKRLQYVKKPIDLVK